MASSPSPSLEVYASLSSGMDLDGDAWEGLRCERGGWLGRGCRGIRGRRRAIVRAPKRMEQLSGGGLESAATEEGVGVASLSALGRICSRG